MINTPAYQAKFLNWFNAFLIGVVIFGLALRVARLFTARLWTDEVFSAAIAKEPILRIIGLTLRHDSHPPLYYIQLHLWQLVSESDTWLLSNSLLLSFATGVSLFFVIKWLYGQREALVGLAIFSVLPLEIVFSETLRMYCLENLLLVWMFFSIECFIRNYKNRFLALTAFVILGSAINLVHGFGAMVTFFMVLYSFWRLFEEKAERHRSVELFLASAAVGLSTSYSVVVGSMRRTIGLDQFSIAAISSELTISLLGFNIPHPSLLGIVLVLPFIIICLFERRSRAIVFWMFLAPTALMVLISVSIKPVFTFRGTGLFMPFEAIGFAVFICSRIAKPGLADDRYSSRRLAIPLLIAFVSIISAASLYNAITYRKVGFEKSSSYWTNWSTPGDVVYVDSFISDYLGFVRYLPGAEPPALQAVQAPAPRHWQSIFLRIGPDWTSHLGLLPNSNHLAYRGRQVFPWFDIVSAAKLPRYWVFKPSGGGCKIPNYRVSSRNTDGSYVVLLCERITDPSLSALRPRRTVSEVNAPPPV